MPHLTTNGVSFHYEDTRGAGPAIVFSHGLLMSGRMFSAQMQALSDRYRCVAYDHRGQGESSDPGGRVHDMETCYRDAVAVIEALDARPCHFVGLSMGGFVGMRLAARRPDLLYSLTLMETSAEPEPGQTDPGYKSNDSQQLDNLMESTGGNEQPPPATQDNGGQETGQ